MAFFLPFLILLAFLSWLEDATKLHSPHATFCEASYDLTFFFSEKLDVFLSTRAKNIENFGRMKRYLILHIFFFK